MQFIRDSLRSSAAILLVIASAAFGVDIHVAPNGNDANPGTADKPYATIQHAVEATRKIERGGEPIVVLVHGGVYRVDKPITLGPADSGTEKAPLIVRGAGDTRPVVSGGRVITGWTVGGDGVWSTTIDAAKDGKWPFRELFVNGERRQRARHPNAGWVRVNQTGADRRTNFTFNDGEVTVSDNAGGALELVFLHDWSMSRVKVASVDPASHTLTTAQPIGPHAPHYAIDNYEPHPRYALENHPALLDAPGEWYLDTTTGVLRYVPMPGESPDKTEIVAPLATSLLEVRGADGKPVRFVRFEGIAFEHCAWALPAGGYAAGQACYHEHRYTAEVKGDEIRTYVPTAVTFEIAEDCAFVNGRVAHTGGSGILFGTRCHRCAIERSVITDTSGNGVMIGEDTGRRVEGGQSWWRAKTADAEAASDNRVTNCVIEHVGAQFVGAVGVWVGLARDTKVEHNEVRYTPYTGISIGWMWNPTPTPAKNNSTSFNHIHHVMQLLSDGGGIYTLGLQPGSTLSGNHIHDVPLNAGRAESNGMFLDEGTTDVVIEGNVIHGVDRSPLRFHQATTNLVKGNVFVVRPGVPHIRYNSTKEENIHQVDNTVVPQAEFDATKYKSLTDKAGVQTK
ncbi:MAG: hypothetical protein GC159_22975 [Phycisphaera sp.]|nr:hypothetical protein [Phycisphaera sp.]